MPWLTIIGVVTVLGVTAFVAHLLLTWFDRRGWVYYRNPDAPKGSSLGLLEEIYQPSASHMVNEEVREASEADQSEAGEPEPPETAT